METPNMPPRISGATILLATVVFSLAMVASSVIIFKGYVQSKEQPGSITVDGLAERIVNADTAKWSVRLQRTATSTKEAQTMLEADGNALREFLKSAKIDDADLSFQPIQAYANGNYYDYPDGESSIPPAHRADASRVVVIESKHASEIGDLAAHSTFDIKGAILTTDHVEFFYSKLSELKKELGEEALQNAQEKAKALIGSQLGKLQAVDAPYFNVSPNTSGQSYNNYENDTSSLEKKVTATVRVSYRL